MKKSQKSRKKASHPELSAINPNAAGIDIGADRHWVSVPKGRDDGNVRSFSCFTGNLYQMPDWLTQCKVETVAMESTGVYWFWKNESIFLVSQGPPSETNPVF